MSDETANAVAEPGSLPSRFGRFEVQGRLGTGAMGEVYRARDLWLGRPVAIKVLRATRAYDPVLLGRFEQEARAASALNHPNIVTIYDIGRSDDTPYIAMELVDGRTLRELLIGRPLLVRRSLQLAVQAAEALAEAHAAGIVHRDLKPENIMVTTEGRVKLLDFGLAKQLPQVSEDAPTSALDTPGTEPGVILGTVGYMSPEAARGGAIDYRADQFSCGAILYEMMAGRPAFHRDSVVQTLAAIIEAEPAPLETLNPEAPAPLRRIVGRCLAKDPAGRYASTADLARDLRDTLADVDDVSTSASTLSGRLRAAAPRRPARLAIAAGAWLAALVLAALWVGRGPGPAPGAAPSASAAPPSVTPRRAVAVLGFRNLSGRREDDWLSTAIAEMLTTELAAGGRLRTIPGENIARAKIELSLAEQPETLGAETLARLGKSLGAALVVLGAYMMQSPDRIRLDLRLQDVATGETVVLAANGTRSELVELASRAGSGLRRAMGVSDPPVPQARLGATMPASLDAQRLYAEGLAKLRVLDAQAARDLLEQAVQLEPGFPLTHAALAEAWSKLGYDARALEAARRAYELSGTLSREDRLAVEGRYREAAAEWDKATDIYRALTAFFPDDIEYGLRLAAALSPAGDGQEALAVLERLRRLPPPASEDPRIDLTEAVVAQWIGDFRRERAAAERAASQGTALGARLVVARARTLEAYARLRLGDLLAAEIAAEEARRIYAETGDRGGAVAALNRIGGLRWSRGELVEARRALDQALALARRIGDGQGTAAALANLGLVLWQQGDLAAARRAHREAEALGRERGGHSDTAGHLENLSLVLHDLGDLKGARRACEEALALAREAADATQAAAVQLSLARVLHAEGRLAEARALYEEALPVLRAAGSHGYYDGVALAGLGRVLEAEGDLAAARRSHEQALDMRTRLGETINAWESQVALAAIAVADGRAVEAEAQVSGALEAFAKQRAADKRAVAQDVLARALEAQGRTAEALAAARRAAALARRSQSPHVRLSVLTSVARLRAGAGQREEAARSLADALSEAVDRGLIGLQLEIRLAQLEVAGTRDPLAHARLEAIAREARARGFGLLARRAAAAAGS